MWLMVELKLGAGSQHRQQRNLPIIYKLTDMIVNSSHTSGFTRGNAGITVERSDQIPDRFNMHLAVFGLQLHIDGHLGVAN